MKQLLEDVKSGLGDCCIALYVYGSQRDRAKIGSDLDLVIVHDEKSRAECVSRLASIQKKTPILLHGIFVSKPEILANPQLQRLVGHAHLV
jgi:hypothetical protein